MIDSVRVGACGGNGIVVGPASMVRNSSVFLTGKAGMLLAEDTLYSGNHVSQASQGPGTERAIEGGHPSAGNHCDDLSCTHDGRRRYYLSTTEANGSLAAQVCETGFHMASLWEILDPTALAYDPTRGRTSQDAGDGPPTDNFGWVRTGKPSSFNGSSPGGASCSGYTSTTGNGTMASLPTDWDWDTTVSGERSRLSTWQTTLIECTTSQDVWCVED